MSRVGLKIRDIRMSKKMTQKQLAKAIGVSEKYVEELESGKKILNDDLLKRVSKVLEQDTHEFMLLQVKGDEPVVNEDIKVQKKPVQQEIQKVWYDAFDSILKTVPVYGDYALSKVVSTKQLPLVSNKVEGYPRDKVLFLVIQDSDMMGFRILKDDVGFGCMTNEVQNNSVCLMEYNNKRVIRQIRKLDSEKLLLVSNNGRLTTETVQTKDVKVLVKLDRLEIKL